MIRATSPCLCGLLLATAIVLSGCARGEVDAICSCCCRAAGDCTVRGIAEARGRDCATACGAWCAGRGCPYNDEPGACDQGLPPEVHDVELSCPAEGCLPDYTYDLTFWTENATEWTSIVEVTIGEGSPGWLTPDSGEGGGEVEARYRAGDGRGDQIVITIEAWSGSGEVGYGSAVATIR